MSMFPLFCCAPCNYIRKDTLSSEQNSVRLWAAFILLLALFELVYFYDYNGSRNLFAGSGAVLAIIAGIMLLALSPKEKEEKKTWLYVIGLVAAVGHIVLNALGINQSVQNLFLVDMFHPQAFTSAP